MKVTPPRFGPGPVQGPELERQLTVHYRDVLSRMDIRYLNHDCNAGVVADGTGGVTLGPKSYPLGRAAAVPTIVQKITDVGTASDQRFLPQVSAGNKLSVQSSLPLTATSTASVATINVASHTLQYGYGQVSYGSGSITGLTPATSYYVYADDPLFSGGAVSYIATTNAQTVVAANGRYYVGSVITAISATTENITAATSANPIAFTTATPHGWATADTVTFAGLPGDFGTNLNGTNQAITVTGSSTFTIAINGSGYIAYTSGGTATRVSNSTSGGGGGGGGGGHSGGPLL
jgi:hypothetical protein